MTSKKDDCQPSEHQTIKETSLTYDDYAALDDGNRYELVDGQLELMTPAPTVTHQMVSYEMQKMIARNCEESYLILHAPVDVILSKHEVRQPDIVVIARKWLEIVTKRGVEGAPNLVIEILSPSTLKRDKIDKLKTYATYQINEYWIVEPEQGILEQYVLQSDRYDLVNVYHGSDLVTSPYLSCISFTMAEIMKNIPELKD